MDKSFPWSWFWLVVSMSLLPIAGCAAKDLSGARDSEGNAVRVKGVRTIKLDAPTYGTIMAWSPDSQRLAVGGPLDKRVSVWDVRTGRRLPGPADQDGGPQALAYSPDGLYLAVARGGVRFRGDVPVPTGPERYVVSLWDARSSAWVQNLVDETQEIETFGVNSIAFSPNGRYLAVNYTAGLAFYAKDGTAWRRTGALAPGASPVVFSPDGTRLIGTTGIEILVYEVPSARIVARWRGLRSGIQTGFRTLAYRPSGDQIAVGEGPRLGLFDTSSGVLLRVLEPAPPYFVKGVSYTPNSQYLAIGVASAAHLVSAEGLAKVAILTEHQHTVDRLALSPDGSLLAATGGSVVTLWELSGF